MSPFYAKGRSNATEPLLLRDGWMAARRTTLLSGKAE
jgi:hypothetical protein